MIDLFSDEARRNPYPVDAQRRDHSPVLEVPRSFRTRVTGSRRTWKGVAVVPSNGLLYGMAV